MVNAFFSSSLFIFFFMSSDRYFFQTFLCEYDEEKVLLFTVVNISKYFQGRAHSQGCQILILLQSIGSI